MALLNPTFIFGIVVLTYLSTFVFFAILRILTGISIQRVGYFSLRRLAYTPKDGVKVEIRGLGLNLHRPTFAQPTWLSVVLTELAITIDLKELNRKKQGSVGNEDEDEEDIEKEGEQTAHKERSENGLKKQTSRTATSGEQERSRSWKQLTRIKDQIKRLHRKINYIRLVDIVATNTTLTVTDVGQVQVGHLTGAVDTRRKMIDRGRMFSHLKTAKKGQRPAEWIFTVRSVLFTAEGRESLEVLDHATLNIHGLLYEELDGLRDAAIGLKLGRVHIPYDDLNTCVQHFKAAHKQHLTPNKGHVDISMTDVIEELDHPGASKEDLLAQTVSDSKEFVSSILRGIKEVQFAVSYVGFTKKIDAIRPRGNPLYLNASMKEVGIDLHRLDQKSPAHRMYFASKDVAHQALLAALSIAVGVDDGQGHGSFERLIYIPMATTTARTTLPAKTVQLAQDNSVDERNANILFANMVVTSPSIDLDPKHLPILLALTQSKSTHHHRSTPRKHVLISRLLPRSNIKFSMHEPVIRIALPAVEQDAEEDDFDLIISSISSVSLDIESSHSATGNLHYGLASTFRVLSHDLYYQTASGAHFDLLQTESMELKVQVSANPEVNVVATGNLQTFSIHMIRPEISDGVRQIVRQLRLNVEPTKRPRTRSSRDPNFVRALPPWLLHFQFQASNFSAEVAGVDEEISGDTRGVAINLESWTAEYRAQKADAHERRSTRRRTTSRSLTPDAEMLLRIPSSPRKRNQQHPTDGRRLAMHVRGLEAFVVESTEKWEAEPFVSMPRCEVALTTSSDNQGPIFHVNSHLKTLLVQYSLYRHYAVGIATTVLKRAFVRTKADVDEAHHARQNAQFADDASLLSPIKSPEDFYTRDAPDYPFTSQELLTIDFKSALIQIKIHMPADPHVMIQIYGMEAGRHRWSPPFLHAKLCRLYAEAPKLKRVWARVLSLKGLRIDIREHRRRHATSGEMYDEKMVDIYSEAIRFAVPHQLVMHKLSDNFVNTMKSVQQLHHRFVTGTNEYILDKKPEGPKNVPKISLRSRAFLFEIEDGAFEWKLGSIYRAGLVEQAQRIAREAAFKVKAKKLEEQEMRRDSHKYRNRSAVPRGRHKEAELNQVRSKSVDVNLGDGIHTRASRGRKMRYDPEGSCSMTASAKISIKEAHEKLNRHNAQSWKKRIDKVLNNSKTQSREARSIFWGSDQLPEEMVDRENILEVPHRPALMATLIHDLHLSIDKPSFPLSSLPDFINKVGKGMPMNTQYSLLIPMHVKLNMGEARVSLRDYPLPLIHVPAIKPGQSPRLSAWSMQSDFVIAEEYRDAESIRHIKIDVVPPEKMQGHSSKHGTFAIDVRRTVSPVKTYSDIKIDINTGYPTRITWGASLQPAIQDMMMVIESFSKPQIDPSDRVGFWDKIRLSFHSRLSVAWKGDGDVHLMLKGTRDPYAVTGNGAGFLMCWRNDVRMNLYREEDPRKFMTVDSGEYILAIPDYSHQARMSDGSENADDESITSIDSFKRGASFKKVVMKLAGNVQWMVGLMFERTLINGGRTFDFDPHYEVILKEPQFAKALPGKTYDAFSGFRSHHIHMSIAVRAPVERHWSPMNAEPSKSYNAVHLTPRFFTHFFSWWAMFNGTMSLPIRQGKLWPGIEKSSKKFGRHLATVKYNLLLAPLFLSHIYKHKDAEDYSEDVVSATGLKIRLDSFMLDMHQRREEFNTLDRGRKTQAKTTGMKMHQAQLDLVSADIRAISASIAGTTSDDLQRVSGAQLISQQEQGAADLSRFEIPDNDFTWIDMDDFVELDWILPYQANPQTKILPLAYAPGFTYFRQTDRGDTIAGDPDRRSPWGNEETHFCIMSHDDDPRRVQCHLIQKRLDQLEQQIASHQRDLGEAKLKCIQDEDNEKLHDEYEQLHRHGNVLSDKRMFLTAMLRDMSARLKTNVVNAVPNGEAISTEKKDGPSWRDSETATSLQDDEHAAEFISDFSNRFVIHNMQLKWNNLLRNIILRYIHQVSQRRGFVYYLSRRAVKFILDIVEEQNKAKAEKVGKTPDTNNSTSKSSPTLPTEEGQEEVQNRINELLADSKKFVNADDPHARESAPREATDNSDWNTNREFSAQNTYHLRLIAPQIQLQSEKNPKAVVLVTAKGMEAKVIEVMDKERLFDDISGLVQRRFTVEMDSTQFFVTHQKWFSSQLLSMYSGSRYGTPSGSAWPPWVPMEVMFDFQTDPFGFKRIVQKTSASLRYSKNNTLRLKYNDEISSDGNSKDRESVESRMDHFSVEFPQIRALCNSSQYYAIYIIVLDLLMYSEPLEKTRSERLEKIMLASDFSDLRGAPEMVIRLQERIRQLEEIKTQFQINSRYLDKQGWQDRLLLDKDLTSCEDELFFMMKAITTSQRKYDGAQTSGLLQWNISADEIVWHLIQDNNEPLMEFQLKKAEYDRTDNSDGSHINVMQVDKLIGLNLLPDAIYPEMFAPYSAPGYGNFIEGGNQKMARVYWYMLEAIAGIPVMDHFEVNLFPLKIQLEHEVGKRLFEYMFPGSDDKNINMSPFLVKNMKPIQDDDEEVDQKDEIPGSNTIDEEPGTRAGSLELRLKPTLNSEIPYHSTSSNRAGSLHSSHGSGDSHYYKFFQSGNRSSTTSRTGSRMLSKKGSVESLKSSHLPRQGLSRSATQKSVAETTNGDGKSKRFHLHRHHNKLKKESPSDDLTEMMSRASNFMTLAYVKMPSVILCLSYKGKDNRNLVDVHDFVFRLPMIEFRNKTWSNLDLALAVKREIIRALISHTGAILGNKFSKHRPSTAQQNRLRELATSSVLLAPSSNEASYDNSETSSIYGTSPTDNRHSDRSKSPRRSFASSNRSNGLMRTPSASSSIMSMAPADNRVPSFPTTMALTPLQQPSQPSSSTDNQSTNGKGQEEKGGFMAHTIHRLKRKGDRSENIDTSQSSMTADIGEATVKKAKNIIGKKILGSLT